MLHICFKGNQGRTPYITARMSSGIAGGGTDHVCQNVDGGLTKISDYCSKGMQGRTVLTQGLYAAEGMAPPQRTLCSMDRLTTQHYYQERMSDLWYVV